MSTPIEVRAPVARASDDLGAAMRPIARLVAVEANQLGLDGKELLAVDGYHDTNKDELVYMLHWEYRRVEDRTG